MIYDINLNIEKSGIKPRIKVSQYDKTLPQIRAALYSNNQAFEVPSGSTVYISGTKADNTGFKYECTYSGNTVTADITEQMTAFSGDVVVEFTIESSGSRKGTENFILSVEPAALADDVIISETDIPAIQRLSQPATTSSLGVVKVDGTSITADEDGTLHASAGGDIVTSVNGETGDVTLTASDVSALPDDTPIPSALSDLTDDSTHRVVTDTEKTTWNNKSDFSGDYTDLTNKPTIPDELADLSDDSTHRLVTDTEKTTWNGKSVVSYNQIQATGTKIAEITINDTTTNIFAPTGGGGGGDMSTSTYDPNGDVATAGGIPAYVSTAIANAITNAIGGSY